MSSLTSLSYYHGTIDTRECREHLPEVGDFLLRNTVGEMDKEDPLMTPVCIITVATAPEKEGYSLKQQCTTRLKSYVVAGSEGLYMLHNTTDTFLTIETLCDSFVVSKKSLPSGGILRKAVSRSPWQLMLSDLEFPTTEIVLGKGSYGRVIKAKVTRKFCDPVDVAVKETNESKDATAFSEAYTEARAMRRLQHCNIIGLEGVVVEKLPILLAIEFFDGASLIKALQEKRITDSMRFPIICNIMYGVAFMHSHGYIHRDIAARNVMVSADCRNVKIIDFGLAKHGLTFKLQIPQKIPVKWLAPEVISTFTFSTKSDVWAFAITAWEVYHDGAEPYSNKQNVKVKRTLKKRKGSESADRLQITENLAHMPPLFDDVFAKILNKSERERPEMDEVVVDMEKIYPTLEAPIAEEIRILQAKLLASKLPVTPTNSAFEKNSKKPSNPLGSVPKSPVVPSKGKLPIGIITKTRKAHRGKKSASASADDDKNTGKSPLERRKSKI